MTARCSSCGAPLAPSDRFCGSCGAPVGGEPAPAPRAGRGDDGVLFAVPRRALESGERARLLDALGAGPEGSGVAHLVPVDPEWALDQVQEQLRRDRVGPRRVRAVCLVGADEDLPMTRVPDPTAPGSGRTVLTDNFFGALSLPPEPHRLMGDVLPEVPVTRIPSTAPTLVKRLVGLGGGLAPSWAGGVAVTAEVWKETSAAVLETIAGAGGPRLEVSPPAVEARVAELLGPSASRAYFNVHGSDQAPLWMGDDGTGRYPIVLRPEHAVMAPGAVVVSEACWAAAIFPGERAISSAFLESGAGCFVGSTAVAWGPPDPPPAEADLIAAGVFQALDDGLPLGEALLRAKTRIVAEALRAGEAPSPQQHNTLVTFVAYGAPMARVAHAAGGPLAGRGSESRPRPTSALDAIRRRMAGATAEPESPLEQVRARIRARISPGAFRIIEDGRRTLAELPPSVRASSQIRAELGRLLGGVGVDEVFWRRYRFETRDRAMIAASADAPPGQRRAAVIIDAAGGRILARYVSR